MPKVTRIESEKEVAFIIQTEEQEKSYREIEEEKARLEKLKYDVKKLLMSKPDFIPQTFDKVIVRCERSMGKWKVEFVDSGKVEYKECLVVRNAVFTTKETRVGSGCGAYSTHIGMASGEMIADGTPVSVPTERVKRLGFDDERGCFYCRGKRGGDPLEACDYLILKEDCHSEFIASDNAG